MDRFRFLNTGDLSTLTMAELVAMLNIAYGDLVGLDEFDLDRVRILSGIRAITREIANRSFSRPEPKPPTLSF